MSLNEAHGETADEQALVKLYMELTGKPECCARSVFMHVCPNGDGASAASPHGLALTDDAGGGVADLQPQPRFPLPMILWPALCLSLAAVQSRADVPPTNYIARTTSIAGTNSFPTQPLSLAEAVDIALQQNPSVLRGRKDVEAAQGIAIQTRAIMIPKLRFAGAYNAVQQSDVDQGQIPSYGTISFGRDQSWSSQIKLVQSIYEGGRMVSANRAAKLTQEQALLTFQTTLANTVLEVQIAYDDVLLAEQQISVQEASVELLRNELADTKRRFDAGTVPHFNVLRAEVELANAQPKLIRARNSFRIAKNNLANLLGFQVPHETLENIPLKLSGTLEKEPYAIELPHAIELALERRTELGALRKAQDLRKEDVVNAKAGYKPSLQAFGGYDARSSVFSTDIADPVHGWITGVQLSWDIFDGKRTKGKVIEARALFDRAGIEIDDTGRRIELEVRTAFSNFIEADELLTSQEKVHEQADEALRLARARSDAGTGTQLDVLSAQTALTEARNTQIQALHDYAVARARLERAVGMNVPTPNSQPPSQP